MFCKLKIAVLLITLHFILLLLLFIFSSVFYLILISPPSYVFPSLLTLFLPLSPGGKKGNNKSNKKHPISKIGAFFPCLFWVTHTVILLLDRPFSISISFGEFLPFNLHLFMVWSVGDMLRFRNLSSLNFPWFCFLFIYFGRDFLGGLIFHWFISSWISLIQLGLVSIEPILVFSISELILSKFSFLCFLPDFIH